MSEIKTIAIPVPQDRQDELRKLHRNFLREAKKCDRLQARRRVALANAADSLLGMMAATDAITGSPFDWELGRSVLLNLKRNQIIIENPTLKAEPDTAHGRRVFTGVSAETGEQLCKFAWDAKKSFYRITALTSKTGNLSQEQAESIYRFLDNLNFPLNNTQKTDGKP